MRAYKPLIPGSSHDTLDLLRMIEDLQIQINELRDEIKRLKKAKE